MQVVEVGEKIKVGAVFEDERVTPKWFFWGRTKHELKSVEHRWRARSGEAALMYFSATDGANVFELQFNLKTAEWFLEKIYTA